MSLPAVTRSLDTVDPAHHDLYSQTDAGTFVLNIAGDLAGHPAVTPLENAYRKEQDKRKRQGRELDALKGQLTGNGSAADAKSLATAARQSEKYRSALETTLVDAALTNALIEANIAAPYLKAALAMHRGKLSVVEDDGGFSVIAGDPDQPQTPKEFVAAWAASDEGRSFVAAPRNGGGAATGSGGGGIHMRNPWRDETFNRTEQARIARDDPALAKRLARAAGKREPRV